MAWRVPLLWAGQTVAILGSGESMSQRIADAVKAAGVSAIAINTTYELAPWADLLFGADASWWHNNPAALRFAGLKVTASDGCRFPEVKRLRNTGPEGFDPDPECLRTGGNGGYAGAHIAAQGGAARILLCGFDMRGKHWHAPHKTRNPTLRSFERWAQRFKGLRDALAAREVELINCTPNSAIKSLRFMALEDALATCDEMA